MTNETRDPHPPANGAEAKRPRSIRAGRGGDPRHRVRPAGRDLGRLGATSAETTQPSPMQALETQVADLKDQVLRAYAEMENVRKRGERERQDTQKYAVSKFARDVLSVADNLERATRRGPRERSRRPRPQGADRGRDRDRAGARRHSRAQRHHADRGPRAPRSTPTSTRRSWSTPTRPFPSGTIVRVFEAGYMIGDRVLRPASVDGRQRGAQGRQAGGASGCSSNGRRGARSGQR